MSSSAVLGWASLGQVISGVKSSPDLRWASPLDVKNSVEKVFLERFGAKEAAKPKGKVRCHQPDFVLPSNSSLRNPRKITKQLRRKRELQRKQAPEKALVLGNLLLKKDSLANCINPEKTLRFTLACARHTLLLPAAKCGHDSLPNLTAIFILGIPKQYSLTLDMLPITGANAICVMTIQIQKRRKPNTLTAFWRWFGG